MMKAAWFAHKKRHRPFKSIYTEWFESLNTTLLPLLRHSMSAVSASLVDSDLPVSHHSLGAMLSSSDLLSTPVQLLHNHFQAYFQALDVAARHDVSQLLCPDWRNSIEKPFLWLGDLHPSLFTFLLRSFISDDSKATHFSVWKNPPTPLIKKIEQIERGLRLMAPALMARFREAHARFIHRVATDWALCEGAEETAQGVNQALTDEMEELTSVFVDANRLRGSILAEIMDAIDIYQAALYLEGLAQFLVGFKDSKLLHSFKHCKMPRSPYE